SGEDPLEPLSRAAGRDQQQTAVFLCLALAVAGQGSRIHASWLGTAFGDLSLDRPVTHGQRALWLAAARGAYGPAGKIFVLRKLDVLVVQEQAEPDQWVQALVPGEPSVVVPAALRAPAVLAGQEQAHPAQWVPARARGAPAVVAPAALGDSPEMAGIPELARPARAAARLSRLRARCEEITSARQADQGSTAPLVNSGAAPAGSWAEDEPLAVLRAMIGLSGPSGPQASLATHLLDDLRPGADPHLT